VYERLAQDVQRQLFEVGVDLQFRVVPFAEYNTRLRKGDFEAALVDLISAPSPGRPYLFWRSARQGKGFNTFGYENAEADRLFQGLRAATTELEVRNITHDLQRVFIDDPPAIFLAWNQRSRAVRREFGVPAEPDADPLLSLWRWGADKKADTLALR
jgi:ABC-type oligopeptide transport system substrate-binding subunit